MNSPLRHGWVVMVLAAACQGVINTSPGVPSGASAAGPTPSAPAGPTYSAAVCEGAPPARTFTGLDGLPLERDRVNAAADLDQRRTRSWENLDAYGGDLNQQLGYYRATEGLLERATAPLRPDFWYLEADMGALELYSQFRVGFMACERMVADPHGTPLFSLPSFASAPSTDTADGPCRYMMRQFWKTEPTAQQVQACADFAVNETSDLPTVSKRWALVCAALLSSTGSTTQ